MAGFETSGHQLFPDFRQLMQLGTKQVDTLSTGNLGVQIIVAGNFTQHDEFFRGNFPPCNPRHNGVSTVFLHVAEEDIVGVLQTDVRVFQHVFVIERRQNGTNSWLTDFTAVAFTVGFEHFSKGVKTFNTDNVSQFSAGVSKVFAQAVVDFHTQSSQLGVHHLLNQRSTSATHSGGFGGFFDIAHGAATALYGSSNITFGNRLAGADLSSIRQSSNAQTNAFSTIRGWHNQIGRIPRNIHIVQFQLQQIAVSIHIAHQHRAQQFFTVAGNNQTFVNLLDIVVEDVAFAASGMTVSITDGCHIHTQQFQFGAHIRTLE